MIRERTSAVNNPSGEPVVRLQRQALATVLVLLDLLYLLANVVHLGTNSPGEPRSLVSDDLWNGDLDGSFIEIFGHAQLIAAAIGLMFVARRRRSVVHAIWAAVLSALVADDFLQLHETFGAAIVRAFDVPDVAFLTAQDLGELLVWAIAALGLGSLLLVGYSRADARGRADSHALLVLIAMLAVFAVGVDQVQGLVAEHLPFVVQVASTLVETSGELLSMTLIVLFVQQLLLRSADETIAPAGDPEDELFGAVRVESR